MINSWSKQSVDEAHDFTETHLVLQELFPRWRSLIAFDSEGQSRNDECSKPTAVSVTSDGRTERDSFPTLHVVPADLTIHAGVYRIVDIPFRVRVEME